MELVGIGVMGMVLTGCGGVRPMMSTEQNRQAMKDSSRQEHYEKIVVRDTVLVGERVLNGLSLTTSGQDRPSLNNGETKTVFYWSHYETRTVRDTVYKCRADTVYQHHTETAKERYVPPFYRWCVGVLIGMVCLGAVWRECD